MRAPLTQVRLVHEWCIPQLQGTSAIQHYKTTVPYIALEIAINVNNLAFLTVSTTKWGTHFGLICLQHGLSIKMDIKHVTMKRKMPSSGMERYIQKQNRSYT